MKREVSWSRVLKNVLFFFNVLLAVMIIFFSRRLIESSFGVVALSFGFVMLAVTTLLKFVQKW